MFKTLKQTLQENNQKTCSLYLIYILKKCSSGTTNTFFKWNNEHIFQVNELFRAHSARSEEIKGFPKTENAVFSTRHQQNEQKGILLILITQNVPNEQVYKLLCYVSTSILRHSHSHKNAT